MSSSFHSCSHLRNIQYVREHVELRMPAIVRRVPRPFSNFCHESSVPHGTSTPGPVILQNVSPSSPSLLSFPRALTTLSLSLARSPSFPLSTPFPPLTYAPRIRVSEKIRGCVAGNSGSQISSWIRVFFYPAIQDSDRNWKFGLIAVEVWRNN